MNKTFASQDDPFPKPKRMSEKEKFESCQTSLHLIRRIIVIVTLSAAASWEGERRDATIRLPPYCVTTSHLGDNSNRTTTYLICKELFHLPWRHILSV